MLGLVGLAMKAGKLIIGEQAVWKVLQLSRAHLLLMATDASDRKKRVFTSWARAHDIPLIELANKIDLGNQLGRGQVAIAAIIDQPLAEAVRHRWSNMED